MLTFALSNLISDENRYSLEIKIKSSENGMRSIFCIFDIQNFTAAQICKLDNQSGLFNMPSDTGAKVCLTTFNNTLCCNVDNLFVYHDFSPADKLFTRAVEELQSMGCIFATEKSI